MAAISGASPAPQAFCGDASSRNEKSGNLASCLLVGGVLFRPLAIRYDVFPGHRGYDTPGVRKHQAPKGALRQYLAVAIDIADVRKHRAPKGALRRGNTGSGVCGPDVRKHRAPKGALRLAT